MGLNGNGPAPPPNPKRSTSSGDRTHDHKIKSLALYHLSYGGPPWDGCGTTSGFVSRVRIPILESWFVSRFWGIDCQSGTWCPTAPGASGTTEWDRIPIAAVSQWKSTGLWNRLSGFDSRQRHLSFASMHTGGTRPKDLLALAIQKNKRGLEGIEPPSHGPKPGIVPVDHNPTGD